MDNVIDSPTLDHKIRDLSVMYELMASIGTSLDLQSELDLFLQKLLKRFGFSLGTILLKEEEGEHFYVAASRGHLLSRSIVGKRCANSDTWSETLLEEKKPLILNDMSGGYDSPCKIPEIWEQTKSLVYFPILFEENVIGILRLFSFSERTIDDKIPRMISPLVARLGTSISHILLLNRLSRTEKKLREERDFNETAFNSLSDLFVVIDPKTKKLVRWNKRVNLVTGFSDQELSEGNFFSDDSAVLSHDPLDAIVHQIQDSYGPGELQLTTKTGEVIPIEVSASRFCDDNEDRDYLIAIGRDIRERKEAEEEKRDLEEQLHQKYKMEAIGLMAGGIAHNFNNSLAIVLGSLEMAQRKSDQPDRVRRYIDSARTAVLRGRDLVGQILAYSRKGASEMVVVRLVDIVKETLGLLKSTNPATVELVYRWLPEQDEITVVADPSRIQEVLLNLYTNAVHAMNEVGTIDFSLETVELECDDIPFQYECAQGAYARLGVRDSGSGMTAETVSRIFDPFFTTKEGAGGTGMGLSTVQGIINQHGGFVDVVSVCGEGTTFFIYFPLAEGETEFNDTADKNLRLGHERILYVDDEKQVAELTAETLSGLGYDVEIAASGADALALIRREPERFDLVVSDQTMPGMTGKDLAGALQQLQIPIPLVLCTGFSSKLSSADIGQNGIKAICSKPLQLSELSKVIRATLDDSAREKETERA